jgi:hypothetical protein
LLCGDHVRELQIPLCLTYRFLNGDHSVFDRGGMAFREAAFHASVAIVRREDSGCTATGDLRVKPWLTRVSNMIHAFAGRLPKMAAS